MEWMCWVAGVVFLIAVCGALAGNKKCQVCGVPIKKKSYHLKFEGKLRRVCPNCNSNITRRESKKAVDRLYKN